MAGFYYGGKQKWEKLSHEDKQIQLYLKQKETLESFLARRAISQAQFDKSFHDLTGKRA